MWKSITTFSFPLVVLIILGVTFFRTYKDKKPVNKLKFTKKVFISLICSYVLVVIVTYLITHNYG